MRLSVLVRGNRVCCNEEIVRTDRRALSPGIEVSGHDGAPEFSR